MSHAHVLNDKGEWVTAVPVPVFRAFGRVVCQCGRKFWRLGRYKEHYAYEHIHMGRP